MDLTSFSNVCCFCGTPVNVSAHRAWIDATDGDGCDNPTAAHAVACEQATTFDEPEFYPTGIMVAIAQTASGNVRYVMSEGDRLMYRPDAQSTLSDYTEYRTEFPDGALPEEGGAYEWVHNGWFCVYDADGEPLSEDVSYSLREALAEACAEAAA